MDNPDLLRTGCAINIQRTDGRVHSAFVSSINYDQKSATVEWYEMGETKGKEVDLRSISLLNPDLVIPSVLSHMPTPPLNEPAKLQRDCSESSEDDEDVSGAYGQKLDESEDEVNSNQISPDTATISSSSRQIAAPKITNNAPKGGSNKLIRQNPERKTQIQAPVCLVENNTTTVGKESGLAPKANNASNQNVRTSSVVKQVEKLKKNREERRQRQAEEKAEREAFLQMAPGNPHWELLNMIMDYRRGLDIKPLSVSDTVEDHTITVCVRKRPLNKKETQRKEVDVITIPSKNQLIVHEPKNKVDLTKYLENQIFKFDYAFDETCTNEIVYRYTAQPLIKTIFDGGFATCFAYGQTGSGKTHTMGGNFGNNGRTQDPHRGIYALAAADVFRLANSPQHRSQGLVVAASFFEIYSGKVFDLLNNKLKLRILEDGRQQVVVVGLTEKVVSTTEEVLELIQKGNQARTSGQTSANSNSSRSHAVFQIIVRNGRKMDQVHGKFSLIDLAGNERGADTSSSNRGTRMEGAEINKSLLALKECIRALGRKGAHLPFRVSKLTQVLRDSFVGASSRTCMIAMVSPGVSSCEHTLNTLRYANRVKELSGGDLPASGDGEGEEEGEVDRGGGGDLQHLRSLNENDMTPEMLNFHQVLSELQLSEEQVLDNHRQTIQQLKDAAVLAERILNPTEEVTYDHEVYCKAWADLLAETKSSLLKAEEKVADYKAKLLVEEQVSRKTKR